MNRSEADIGNLAKILPAGDDGKGHLVISVLEAIHDGIVVVDVNSTIIYANPAYTRNFGVPVKKVLGKKLVEIEPASRILEVLRTGEPIVDDTSYVKSVGIHVMANITPVFAGGKLHGAVAIFRDITEVMNLEQKLRETSRERDQTKDISERYFSELQQLRGYLQEMDQIVCESQEMRRVMELASQVGKVDSTIIITGESGVGKEVIARLLHRCSNRFGGPFIVINCGAIPENLLESELFGYTKGSFTGASKEGKMGLLELAHQGTLFLDEIGELPLSLQVKLLRVIQERKVMRIGGLEAVEVDVRFIAATNRNLEEMVQKGQFRLDLFYRLNVIPLWIPPLRNRKEDIVPLAKYFLNKLNEKYDIHKRLMPEVLRYLENYSWPGNVRELENVIERLIVSSATDFISLKDVNRLRELALPLDRESSGKMSQGMSLPEAKDQLEKELLIQALNIAGTTRGAAKLLGVNHATVSRRAKRYNISWNDS